MASASGMSSVRRRGSRPSHLRAGHHDEYSKYSTGAREIGSGNSPIVIAASIDEQYIDFRGCERLYRKPVDHDDDATILRVVREITATIHAELSLPPSAGRTSKPMAKVASGLAKPRGCCSSPRDRASDAGAAAGTQAPRHRSRSPKKSCTGSASRRSRAAGRPEQPLRRILRRYTSGISGAPARGLGSDELGRERPAFSGARHPRGERVGSISNERTFAETGREATAAVLSACASGSAHVRASAGDAGGRVTLKLATRLHTITRSRTIAPTSVDVETTASSSSSTGRPASAAPHPLARRGASKLRLQRSSSPSSMEDAPQRGRRSGARRSSLRRGAPGDHARAAPAAEMPPADTEHHPASADGAQTLVVDCLPSHHHRTRGGWASRSERRTKSRHAPRFNQRARETELHSRGPAIASRRRMTRSAARLVLSLLDRDPRLLRARGETWDDEDASGRSRA